MIAMRTLLLVVAGMLAAMGVPASGGDWGVRFSYNSGYYRTYCAAPSYVYYETSPVVYYSDYSPDVVVYDRPSTVYYRSYDYSPDVVVVDRPVSRVYASCWSSPRVSYYDRSPRISVSARFGSGRSYYAGRDRWHRDCSPRISFSGRYDSGRSRDSGHGWVHRDHRRPSRDFHRDRGDHGSRVQIRFRGRR